MWIERLVVVVLAVVSVALFLVPFRRRLDIINSIPGEWDNSDQERRTGRFILEVLFQSKVIRQRPLAGFMHALVFWGFMTFMIITLDHFCRGPRDGFGFALLGNGGFFSFARYLVAVFAALVIVGINYLTYRRFVERPKALGDHLSMTSGVVAVLINILMITYLIDAFECTERGTTGYSVLWWIHAAAILAFPPLIVRSKHLHLVLSPVTTFFKPFELARIKPLDFEKEEFGAETLKDLGRFTALGAFSCVECGRCFDNCPAAGTEKELDPKKLILDIKAGLLKDIESPVTEDTLSSKVIWQCTTCGSCTYQCPVGVEHVTPIIETRRGLTAGGEFPDPLKTMFKSLERHQNPWGYTQDQAEDFLEENGYPKFKDQDVLYWMGCLARYDDLYRKVSLAFKEKLEAAGVSFGVLYNEACTGDAARRAGNEFVFQEIAESNVEKLNGAAPKKIVTTCPHCLRTLKEYRDFGLSEEIEIVHHATFLNDMAREGKVGKADLASKKVVFHDACYLSRYEAPAGYREPRRFLKKCGVRPQETRRTREKSFCCGAGGAQFFNEEVEGKRINHERVDEILEIKPDAVITACPFCQAMLRDGLADRGVEDVEVRDLAQI